MCAVCSWPGSDDAVCAHCGWERVGELAGRQRDHDLRAAGRVAAATWRVARDSVLLGLLGGLVRGGRAAADEVQRAMDTVNAEEPPPPAGCAGLVFALTRLVAGKTAAIVFCEIGPDAVSVQTLVANVLGVPDRMDGGGADWTDVFPSLPVPSGLRHLRMAGGVGEASAEWGTTAPDVLIAKSGGDLRKTLLRLRSEAAASAGARAGHATGRRAGRPDLVDTVLVRRIHNWPLLTRVAASARDELRPVAEVLAASDERSLADLVEAVAVGAPLRYGYDLILVDVAHRTGAVRPRGHELFPAGTAAAPDAPRVVTIAVQPAVPQAKESAVLPIVARRGPVTAVRDIESLADKRPLVAMAELDVGVRGAVAVSVEMAGPGRVRVLSAPGVGPASSGAPGWPELMADLPDRRWEPPRLKSGSLDLVLLIELGGAVGEVTPRMALASGLTDRFLDVPGTRLAVLGYRDHHSHYPAATTGRRGREQSALIVGSTDGFGDKEDVRRRLRQSGWWEAADVGDDTAAPVECALWLLTKPGWKWRAGARHVAVVIGSKPPYPYPAVHEPDGPTYACSERRRWQEAVEMLRMQSLEYFVVLDKEPDYGYAERTWAQLADPGNLRIAAAAATAQTLARDCGLAPRSRSRLRLATIADTPPLSGTRQEATR